MITIIVIIITAISFRKHLTRIRVVWLSVKPPSPPPLTASVLFHGSGWNFIIHFAQQIFTQLFGKTKRVNAEMIHIWPTSTRNQSYPPCKINYRTSFLSYALVTQSGSQGHSNWYQNVKYSNTNSDYHSNFERNHSDMSKCMPTFQTIFT